MLNKSPRKTPARSEQRRQKRATAPLEERARKIPSADWLPKADAGFVAWGHAAERAHREARSACQHYQQNRGDIKLRQQWEDGNILFHFCLQRAYPAGFWEGMADFLAGTSDNLEPYLIFLEADLSFHRSGYAKSEVIRGLKRMNLTTAQKRRLQNVVMHVLEKGFRREFRAYCRLARAVQSPDWLHEVETRLASSDRNIAVRAKWVLEACRKKEGTQQ